MVYFNNYRIYVHHSINNWTTNQCWWTHTHTGRNWTHILDYTLAQTTSCCFIWITGRLWHWRPVGHRRIMLLLVSHCLAGPFFAIMLRNTPISGCMSDFFVCEQSLATCTVSECVCVCVPYRILSHLSSYTHTHVEWIITLYMYIYIKKERSNGSATAQATIT